MNSEIIKQGLINGKEYSGFYVELPNSTFMASLVASETGESGFGENNTKVFRTKEEAIEAIFETWNDLEKGLK